MTHKDEIKYWAEHPDETKVWWRGIDDIDWMSSDKPLWTDRHIYIVDDQWAELRKAQADGKQLQFCIYDEWTDSTLTLGEIRSAMSGVVSDWRIKQKEPVYEWQWIFKDIDKDKYYMTTCFYTEKGINADFKQKPIERYEPSKRKKNGL